MKTTIQALIVDDEERARILLASLLAVHPEVEIIGMVGSVEEARKFLERRVPDLVFLDMEMPGALGTDLQNYLQPSSKTIFVTAFEKYALEAFEFGARGFLLKPVDSARLEMVLERLRPEPPPVASCIVDCVTGVGSWSRIAMEKILWIEACRNHSLVHQFGEGTGLMVSMPLAEWEQRLPRGTFARISRSLIINLDQLQTLLWRSRNESAIAFQNSPKQLLIGRTASLHLKRILSVK